MRTISAITLALGLAVCGLPATAGEGAGELVTFSRGGGHGDYSLFGHVTGQSANSYDFQRTTTALIDLNDDGLGEIAAKELSSGGESCILGARCPVRIIGRAADGGYGEYWQGYAADLQLLPDPETPMKALLVDGGNELWRWDGYEYVLDLSIYDKTIELEEVIGVDRERIAGFLEYNDTPVYSDTVLHASVTDVVADAAEEIVVRVDGPGICNDFGCPIYMMYQNGDQFFIGRGADVIALDHIEAGVGEASLPPAIITFHGQKSLTRYETDDSGAYRRSAWVYE